MPRPIQVLVHADALAHNLQRARLAAPGARVWAVVKANAYGHGIERIYPGLRAADGFALLDLDEAERLRALGWRGPVLLLEGAFDARDLDVCSRLNLWHTVHCEAQIDWLAAHHAHVPHHVFLKLNSGMNRLGFTPSAYRTAWLRLSGLSQVGDISLMTHLADADSAPDTADACDTVVMGSAIADRTAPSVLRQLAVFEAATAELPGERSVCNSAATLRYAADRDLLRGDWIRPGIMLYGASPDYPTHSSADWKLQPAMTLLAQIIATQDVRAGDCVGYGSRYRAERAMRIGIVACGYADGYPRSAACDNEGGAPVLVDGVRSRIVGRVSMDMITVDLTSMPDAGNGSEVTLWGRASNGALLSIDEVAASARTIGYELMCGVAARVPIRVA